MNIETPLKINDTNEYPKEYKKLMYNEIKNIENNNKWREYDPEYHNQYYLENQHILKYQKEKKEQLSLAKQFVEEIMIPKAILYKDKVIFPKIEFIVWGLNKIIDNDLKWWQEDKYHWNLKKEYLNEYLIEFIKEIKIYEHVDRKFCGPDECCNEKYTCSYSFEKKRKKH